MLFVPSWGRQYPASRGFVLRIGESGVYSCVEVLGVGLTIVLVLVLVFFVDLVFEVFVWVRRQEIVEGTSWVVVAFCSEIGVPRRRWRKEEGLRWVDDQGAWMSWRYGPILAVPVEIVVGSWYVDKAVWSSVS